jgi:hypothetical protein
MALTNPTPVAYQTLETLMQRKKENSEPVVEKKGLLGPKAIKCQIIKTMRCLSQ